MAQHELDFRNGYDLREFAASPTPIDEDPVAMRQLFEYMRGTVVADLDAYTSGAYDIEHDFESAMALGMTRLSSRNDYHTELAREVLDDPAKASAGKGRIMKRAYDVVEAIELADLASYQAEEPGEAWERALDVAAGERMRRELEGIHVRQRIRALGRTALGFRFNTGQ